MTIREILNESTKRLSKSSNSASLDSEVLLSHLLDQPKEYLLINPDKQLTLKQEKQFHILLTRRAAGWPVAYIKNEKEFFGRKFYVDENVLIPRPETEGLVNYVIDYVKHYVPKKSLNILDIGVGSGAIIVSLATTIPGQFFGSDVSTGALKVAKQNAKTHKAKVTFKLGSLLEPWKKQSFDIIVSNLPYLAKETDPSTKFEPKTALVAKKNGLALFEELFKQISPLTPFPSALFLEIGHDQGPAIKKLATKWLPEFEIKISKDLSGRVRYAMLALKH